MTALTRRRALFTGAAMGSAVALPATANATANATATADAELIALCNQFIDLERQRRSLYHTARIDDDAERDKAVKPIGGAQEALADQIEDLPICTASGMTAVATAAVVWWPSLLDEDSLDGRLIAFLLRALAPEAVEEAERMQEHVNVPTPQDLAWASANAGVA